MPLFIAIGFVALVVGEIYALVAVAHATSVLIAVLLLLGTSVLGGSLVRREGAKAWARAAQAVQEGRAPGKDVADGALILAGGVLLFVPGFITDAIGLLLVLPPTRRLFRGLLGVVLIRRVSRIFGSRPGRGRGPYQPPRRGPEQNPSVIEGEILDPPGRGNPED